MLQAKVFRAGRETDSAAERNGEEEVGGSNPAPIFHSDIETPSTLPRRKDLLSLPIRWENRGSEKLSGVATAGIQTQKETPFLIWT